MRNNFFKVVISCFLIVNVFGNECIATASNELQVYIAKDEAPKDVLYHLLGLYGYDLSGLQLPGRPISGKFEVRSVPDIMSYFQRAYHINWFEYGLTVYIYKPSDWGSERFYVGEFDASTDWKEMLGNAGLYQSNFNAFYSSKSKELTVSGPSAYISLVRKAFKTNPPHDSAKSSTSEDSSVSSDKSDAKKNAKPEIMMFPLKYASVEDRTITLRDTKYTTPGILSVLKRLLNAGESDEGHGPDRGADPYGLGGVQLSALAYPGTAVQAASELVKKSVRGEDTPNSSIYPNGVPKLSGNRNIRALNSSIDVPVPGESSGQSLGESGPSLISADTRTNSIVIRDLPDRYNYYKSIIEKLDIPISMIEVEAMLVELDSSSLNELGVEFGVNQGKVRYNFPDIDDTLTNAKTVVDPLNDLVSGTATGSSAIVDPTRFVARLRALASKRHAKVLARPTIVTQDNVPAFIDLSQTLYLKIEGERVAQVEKVTAGSLLQVTPRLVDTGDKSEISMSVEIQDGTLQNNGQNENPSVRNTKLSTQALIGRGKAILIGGYNRESQSDVEHKVPLLGDLPIIGKAFTSTTKSTTNNVRLFLIIPRVLSEPSYYAKSTRDAVEKVKGNFSYDDPALDTPAPINLYKLDSKLSVDKK